MEVAAAAPEVCLQPPSATFYGMDAKPIRRLDEATVNRIAAGEVIQRPSNAVKELLENALDAQSTRIVVSAASGGLKQLSIQDNGTGIRCEDLPILCERFTTSKITKYEDLQSITSYGFRGEALASISHASHLHVTTKVKGESHGWKASYADGKLISFKAGEAAQPKPAASNDGTLIMVEDLFFNMPSRRKAIRSPSDEYNRLLDVVGKYSIHNAGVSMVCKKIQGKNPDLATSTDASTKDNIGTIYGDAVKRELHALNVPHNDDFGFSATGYVTGTNYIAKKGTFLFFINNRLVDCSPLRKGFEAFYSTLLPKGGQPFIYLSLEIAPDKIDVNVHPTKSEVLFEDQDEIIQLIMEALGTSLAEQSTSRKLDGGRVQNFSFLTPDTSAPTPSTSTAAPQRHPPQKLVRTDASARTLQEMFGYEASHRPSTPPSRHDPQVVDLTADEDQPMLPPPAPKPAAKIKKSIKLSNCHLTSVQELRAALETNKHRELTSIIAEHTFVGLIGPDRPLSTIQHLLGLYMINHDRFVIELFYQLGLRQFGKMGKLNLEPAPNIEALIQLVVDHQPEEFNGMDLKTAAKDLAQLWVSKRFMLEEYFKMDITEDGTLKAIPLLLPGYQPVFDRLPLFMVQGAIQTEWDLEKPCFDTLLRQLALFHVPAALSRPNTDEQQWQIQNVLFPALKAYLVAPVALAEKGSIIQLAALDKLYRVFERC